LYSIINGIFTDIPNLPASALKKMCDDFVSAASVLEVKQFKSVGLGTDVRLKGKDMLGSGLVYEEELIHGAFVNNG
jgi:hypothetical protein